MNIILLLLFLSQTASVPSTLTPIQRLRAKIPVVAVTYVTPAEFAGHYTSESEELRRRVGSFLSGNDLYLFPDETYIYCEWADVEPVTVRDKGKWKITDGHIVLTSDPEVTWDPRFERKYAAVRRTSHDAEILLIGIGGDLEYFEKEAGDNPELMLIILAKQRVKPLNKTDAERLKKKLMKDAWRPEYFRKG